MEHENIRSLMLWIIAAISTPILLIGVHLWAEVRYPSSGNEIGSLLFVVAIVFHGFYIVALQKIIRTKIDKLISSEGETKDVNTQAATTISISIIAGFSVFLALLVFNFYGHDRAARYDARSSQLEMKDSSGAFAESGVHRVAQEKDDNKVISTEKVSSKEQTFLERSGKFLGPFGDFFGGIVNPLLTAGTLVAVAVTILMQRTQLDLADRNTKKSVALMERQGFETTFFNMLGLHNATIRDLQFTPKIVSLPVWYNDPDYVSDDIEGENIEKEVFDNVLDEDWDYEFDYEGEPDELLVGLELTPASGRTVFARVLELMDSDNNPSSDYATYHRIQKYHNYVLGHYFRTLYQILELVDEHFGFEAYEEATRYTSIIRAQLSANELVLLFYNCSYRLVDNGEFRRLIVRYEIFEHMPLDFQASSGVLLTPGYSFDMGRHIYQYLNNLERADGVEESGAFGKNPPVARYIAHKKF